MGDYFVKEKSELSQAHTESTTKPELESKMVGDQSPHSSPVALKAYPGGTRNREVNTKSTHVDGDKSLYLTMLVGRINKLVSVTSLEKAWSSVGTLIIIYFIVK